MLVIPTLGMLGDSSSLLLQLHCNKEDNWRGWMYSWPRTCYEPLCNQFDDWILSTDREVEYLFVNMSKYITIQKYRVKINKTNQQTATIKKNQYKNRNKNLNHEGKSLDLILKLQHMALHAMRDTVTPRIRRTLTT